MTTQAGPASAAPPWGRGWVPADTFAARLALARMHADNITIRDAAERCGLNYGSWSNWERGKKPRDLLETVEAISEGLGVDRDWLLFGGPLADAEENRQRWRPAHHHHQVGGDIDQYRPLAVHPIGGTAGTRPSDTRPANRTSGVRLVAA